MRESQRVGRFIGLGWAWLGLALLGTSCSSHRGGRAGSAGGGGEVGVAPAPPSVRAQVLGGLAEIRASPGEPWRRLQPGEELPQGAAIQTGATGRVELGFQGNGSSVRLEPGTSVTLERLAFRDTAESSGLDVVIRIGGGHLAGSFQSGDKPSLFEIVPPAGSSVLYRPTENQAMSFEVTIVQTFAEQPFRLLLASDIFSGGASYVALNGGQPYPANSTQPTSVPEPSTFALWALGGGLLWLRSRRP